MRGAKNARFGLEAIDGRASVLGLFTNLQPADYEDACASNSFSLRRGRPLPSDTGNTVNRRQ